MRTTAIASSLLLLFLSAPAAAKEYVVQMKNNGAKGAMVFEPAFLRIAPGDTVRFVPSDKTHNAETIPGMLPAGAVPFVGKVNQPIAAKLDKPGVYGIECKSHLSVGMVAVVQVGAGARNVAQAKAVAMKLPPLAKKRMLPILASVN